MTGLHSVEASRLLQALVRIGFLESHNPGRGAVYCLPGAGLPTPEDVFGGSSEHLRGSSSEQLSDSPAQLTGERDEYGRRLTSHLDAPILDSLEHLPEGYKAQMEALANAAHSGKLNQGEMRAVILAVCKGQYVTGPSLARLLQRSSDALRQQHLKPLVVAGHLRLAFPTKPTHQMQAYRTTESE